MFYPRTDLALELQEELNRAQTHDLDGIETETGKHGEVKITKVKITSEQGAKKLGKPIGTYITLEMENLTFQDTEQYKQACNALKEAIELLHQPDRNRPILVVGLGNRFITADALGPKVADRIFVTRHLHGQLQEVFGDTLASVCAVAPGVLGITGVETAEIVEGVCARVHPGLILVIDALAAREAKRLNTTVQLCDTGITPGSGVGNSRAAFNKERFGVPVLAIGVPTVIDALTMAYNTAFAVLHAAQSQSGDTLSCLQNLTASELYEAVENIMGQQVENLTVTPKEVDFAMERISKVIAGGINLYLHKDMTVEELDSLTM